VPVESIEAVEKKTPPAEVGVLTVRVPDEYSKLAIGSKYPLPAPCGSKSLNNLKSLVAS